MSAKSETTFRKRVVKDLKTLSNIHIFSIQQTSIVGSPDLVICLKGRFIALELKSVTKEATGIQKYNLECVEKSGGIGLTAYPENWAIVFERLKNL